MALKMTKINNTYFFSLRILRAFFEAISRSFAFNHSLFSSAAAQMAEKSRIKVRKRLLNFMLKSLQNKKWQ